AKRGMSKTFKALMEGTLKNKKTWEAKLTEVGQKAEDEEEKEELKQKAWGKLLKDGKVGYFALLKNLRNIEEDAPESLKLALEKLVSPGLIKTSLVLPFRFLEASKHVSERKTIEALNDALEISLNNVPKLKGKTLIVLDVSGSMSGKPEEIGSI